jgi:hypothetical protein
MRGDRFFAPLTPALSPRKRVEREKNFAAIYVPRKNAGLPGHKWSGFFRISVNSYRIALPKSPFRKGGLGPADLWNPPFLKGGRGDFLFISTGQADKSR